MNKYDNPELYNRVYQIALSKAKEMDRDKFIAAFGWLAPEDAAYEVSTVLYKLFQSEEEIEEWLNQITKEESANEPNITSGSSTKTN